MLIQSPKVAGCTGSLADGLRIEGRRKARVMVCEAEIIEVEVEVEAIVVLSLWW